MANWQSIKADPDRLANARERNRAAAARRRAAGLGTSGPSGRGGKNRPSGKHKPRERQFLGLSGQFICEPNGKTRYVALQCSDGRELVGDDLSSVDVFEFLLELGSAGPSVKIVGYDLKRDMEAWLKDVGVTALRELYRYTRAVAHLEGVAYILRYLPGHWLEVWSLGRYARVDDSFRFQQIGLPDLTERWSLDADRRTHRHLGAASFSPAAGAQTALVAAIDAGTQQHLGVRLRNFASPGELAGLLMRRENVQQHLRTPENPRTRTAILGAYAGGRMHSVQLGEFPKVYECDMNSAYGAALVRLPSLQGKWRYTRTYEPDAETAVWSVAWDWPEYSYLAPLPFRLSNQMLVYPLNGQGYYWSYELNAALARRPSGSLFRVHYGWVFEPETDARPFGFVAELYRLRQRLRLSGDPFESVLKLTIASIYGRLAQQRVLFAEHANWTSLAWAGMVTAMMRGWLYEQAMSREGDVVALQADGIWSTRPVAVNIGDELGQWKTAAGRDFFHLETGISHCAEINGASKTASRGLRGESLTADVWDELRALWRRDGIEMEGEVRQDDYVSLGQSIGHGLRGWRTIRKDQPHVVKPFSIDNWEPVSQSNGTVRLLPRRLESWGLRPDATSELFDWRKNLVDD